MLETVIAFFVSKTGGGVSRDWLSARDEYGESEVHVLESVKYIKSTPVTKRDFGMNTSNCF